MSVCATDAQIESWKPVFFFEFSSWVPGQVGWSWIHFNSSVGFKKKFIFLLLFRYRVEVCFSSSSLTLWITSSDWNVFFLPPSPFFRLVVATNSLLLCLFGGFPPPPLPSLPSWVDPPPFSSSMSSRWSSRYRRHLVVITTILTFFGYINTLLDNSCVDVRL